jgi:hypothetical protein
MIFISSHSNEILLQKMVDLVYSREEIRLPACKMMSKKYDFGNFNMKAIVSMILDILTLRQQ